MKTLIIGGTGMIGAHATVHSAPPATRCLHHSGPRRGNTLAYEPDSEEVRRLGYGRNDCARAVVDVVAAAAH